MLSEPDERSSILAPGAGVGNGENTSGAAKKLPYPKSVFLILGNEFCERFSYYGMRAILTLYLRNVLKFEELTATTIYHGFAMLAYVTPLFGAMLADSFLGKFKTILYLSLVYAMGSVVLSLAATPPVHLPAVPFSMVGLVLIAVGTGGIKPCVSAFGGDQFKLPEQEKELASFFSIFYFSINAGSVISTFLTPIFREDVSCFGDNTCYSLAFSVPAVLMIIAFVIFLLGKNLYIIKEPAGNVILVVIRCVTHALSRKKKSTEKKEHWLDYADDKYYPQDIEDIKLVLRVLFLYLPLPLFWALSDQQGSTWTLQASRMEGRVGRYTFLPDQMQVINPVLVMILIPIFDRYIYPFLSKFGLLKKPLQRLTTGGVFAGIAFIVSGLVELELQKTYPIKLGPGESNLNFISMVPHNLTGSFTKGPVGENPAGFFHIWPYSSKDYGVVPNGSYEVTFESENGRKYPTTFTLTSQNASSLLITPGPAESLDFTFPENTFPSEKSPNDAFIKSCDGRPYVRIIQVGLWANHMNMPEGIEKNETLVRNYAHSVTLVDGKNENIRHTFSYEANPKVYSDWRSTPSRDVDVAVYKVMVGDGPNATTLARTFKLELGGSYVLTIMADPGTKEGYRAQLNTIVEPNSLHMFWLFPQYLLMTIGEVMFAVTLMDFSYSQAPQSMKSVMQSAWLMTVAFGNLIVMIVAEARFFEKQWKQFFLFAGLMFADMLLFGYMAYRYKPAKVKDEEEERLLAKFEELESEDEELERSVH